MIGKAYDTCMYIDPTIKEVPHCLRIYTTIATGYKKKKKKKKNCMLKQHRLKR